MQTPIVSGYRSFSVPLPPKYYRYEKGYYVITYGYAIHDRS